MSEQDTQRAIVEALRGLGAIVIRVQSGKVKVARGWMQLAPEGTPDLCVIAPNGVHLWLEVKDAKGKLREGQVVFADALRSRQVAVRTARTVEEAVRAYLEVKDAQRGV